MELGGTPIVIDVGSRLTKVGLACQPEPAYLFPTIVARPRVSNAFLRSGIAAHLI